MKEKIIISLLFFFFFFSQQALAAHFIVGYVPNARDGTLANGRIVTLWNPANGIDENLTDIIGTSGNSAASNVYLIDCELLNTSCVVGDEIRVQVFNPGDNYFSNYVNLTVTGAGFDVMQNISINSPPSFFNLTIEDDIISPVGEIDLNPFSVKNVSCKGVVNEYDGNSTLTNFTSEFFSQSQSFFGDSNDNNYHYTNTSCFLNDSYGTSSEIFYTCSHSVQYFAEPGDWNCTINIQDDFNLTDEITNTTEVNTLLALSVVSEIEFEGLEGDVGSEESVSVTNAGNIQVNLSLSGYGQNIGDNNSMYCDNGENISIGYMKYNLTSSNPGTLTLPQFESLYKNLTSSVFVNLFNLNRRANDAQSGLDDTNTTYWRVYVPAEVEGHCEGNIVFGATQAPAS